MFMEKFCNLMVYKLPLITVREDEILTIRLLKSSTRPLKAHYTMCSGSPPMFGFDVDSSTLSMTTLRLSPTCRQLGGMKLRRLRCYIGASLVRRVGPVQGRPGTSPVLPDLLSYSRDTAEEIASRLGALQL
jgi:hypothetical protein